jgi:hypothetical protein
VEKSCFIPRRKEEGVVVTGKGKEEGVTAARRDLQKEETEGKEY